MKGSGNHKRIPRKTDLHTDITYFRYSGEVNTANLLNLARQRAIERGINNTVIASETGLSAMRAVEVFRGTGLKITVVTHYPASTASPKGRIPIGINREEYESTRKFLEDEYPINQLT